MKNEPAFPLTSETACRPGLTKLEYAAIEAMKANIIRGKGNGAKPPQLARFAIEDALALLAGLEKEQ